MNFLLKNNNLSKIYKKLLKDLEFTSIDSSKYKFSHDFPNLNQKRNYIIPLTIKPSAILL